MTREPHVLLVEDSELVTGALRILLESDGYRVTIAPTVASALGVSTTDPPSLALLDLTLPDGDGLTLVEPLRVAGCTRVIALTGHDDSATRDRCLAAGCVDVLVKPVPARDLLASTRSWIE
ncbi:MAG: response regulator [Gemmatimonadaceae bacterium]